MNRCLFLLVLSTCILGCQKSTHPIIPPTNVPTHFTSMPKNYSISTTLPEEAWWRQFKDHNLNQLLTLGLKNNLDIHIALSHVKESQGQLQQIKLNSLPMIRLLGGYSTNPALGIPGTFYGVLPYYALNISQQLHEQKAAEYELEYYQAMQEGIRLAVIGQMTSSYFILAAQKEQLKLIQYLLKDTQEIRKMMSNDITIGLKNNRDITPILIEEQNIIGQIKHVQNNLVVSANALHYFLNENPGTMQTSAFEHFNFTTFKPGNLPATVLNHRPDFKMAVFALKKRNAEVKVAYSDFFPLLKLDDFIGEAYHPHQMFAQASDAYLKAQIKPSTIGKINARNSALEAAQYEYIKTTRQIIQEVDNDFSAHQHILTYYQTKKKAEEAYYKKYQLDKELFTTGLLSYDNLLKSRRKQTYLALETNQAKLQLALSLVKLYQDLAGGYKVSANLKDRNEYSSNSKKIEQS